MTETLLTKGIADYLQNAGIGSFGNYIFIGTRPSEPIDCLTLYDTGGFKPQKDTTSDPTVAVLVRDKLYPAGMMWIKEVHKLLKDKNNFWLGEHIRVFVCEATNEPGFIGKDENGNFLFSSNYHLRIKYH